MQLKSRHIARSSEKPRRRPSAVLTVPLLLTVVRSCSSIRSLSWRCQVNSLQFLGAAAWYRRRTGISGQGGIVGRQDAFQIGKYPPPGSGSFHRQHASRAATSAGGAGGPFQGLGVAGRGVAAAVVAALISLAAAGHRHQAHRATSHQGRWPLAAAIGRGALGLGERAVEAEIAFLARGFAAIAVVVAGVELGTGSRSSCVSLVRRIAQNTCQPDRCVEAGCRE